MAATAFICFAATDRKAAEAICAALERRGVRCWIASRDVLPGETDREAVVQAIRSAATVVFVFSAAANASPQAEREIALAVQGGTPIIPIRVENAAPGGFLAHELGALRWIDFFDDWDGGLERLMARIAAVTARAREADIAAPPPAPGSARGFSPGSFSPSKLVSAALSALSSGLKSLSAPSRSAPPARPDAPPSPRPVREEAPPASAMAALRARAATARPRPLPEGRLPGEEGRDVVDISAFAPALAPPGGKALVQIFLHVPRQAAIAKALAKESDPFAERRGIATLAIELARGQRVDIVLECEDLRIAEPAQYLIWRGDPRGCQFLVALPADAARRNFHLCARAFVDSTPVGSLRFTLTGAASGAAAGELEMRGDSAKRYERAFLSYASADRAEVLKRAQALRAARIEFFQDVLNLEPGERWERRLYEEIDDCDLFLLFWSSSAASSPWVAKEAERALRRWRETGGRAPDITPVILEGPPTPKPPDSLSAIHFNDPLRYVIAAIEPREKMGPV